MVMEGGSMQASVSATYTAAQVNATRQTIICVLAVGAGAMSYDERFWVFVPDEGLQGR